MTLKIDDNLLNDVGLGDAPEDQKQAFVLKLLEVLELRVGMRLAQDLSDEQLAEFEKISSQDGDPSQAGLEWLQKNHPNYETILSEESEKLVEDVKSGMDTVFK